MIEINASNNKTIIKDVTYFEYDDTNNAINKYKLNFEDIKEKTWTFKINKDGKIVSKTNKAVLYFGNTKCLLFSYDNENISNSTKVNNPNAVLTGNEASNNYTYNEKGLVTNVRGGLSDGQI